MPIYEVILEDFLALLVSYEGVNAKDEPDTILDIVAPPPTTKQNAHEFIIPNAPQDRNSTCLVFLLGLARKQFKKYGINHLQSALIDAKGVHTLAQWEELKAFCAEHDALFTPKHPGPGIRPGSGIHIETANSRHWRGVLSGHLDANGSGTELVTIDGGGKTLPDEKGNGGGYQLISRAHPVVEKYVDVGKFTGRRPIIDWVDLPLAIANYLAKQSPKVEPPKVESCPATQPAPVVKPSGPLLGIDVSSNNGAVDWSKVKQSGMKFAYVRCGLGIDDVDKRYAINAKGCRDNALDFGLFHFLYPRHNRAQDADKQALQMVGHIKASKCTLRPMVDVESAKDIDPNTTGPEWRMALRMFCLTMRANGIEPLIYTGRWFWTKYPELVNDPLFASFNHWLAAYVPDLAKYIASQPLKVLPWTKVDVWQKLGGGPPDFPDAFRGKCPGVSGDVDVDESYLSFESMRLRAA